MNKNNEEIKEKADASINERPALDKKFKIGKKATERNSRNAVIAIGITTLSFLVVILVISVIFVKNVLSSNRSSVLNELEEYTETTQHTLNTRIEGNFDTLKGLAICFAEMDSVTGETIGKLLKDVNDNNAFIRMGYANTSGITTMYDINGSVYNDIDYSEASFFKEALSGKNAIAKTSKDSLSDMWLVRYAVPVVRNNNVIGVVIAVNVSDIYSDIIDLNIWEDYGYSNIIDSEGTFIIRATRSSLVANDALTLQDLSIHPEDVSNKLKKAIESENGFFDYISNDGKRVFSYVKQLDYNDWYVVSSVLDDYITMNYYENASITLLVLFVSLLIFVVIICISIRMIRLGQLSLKMKNQENEIVIEHSGKRFFRYNTNTHIREYDKNTASLFGLPEVMYDYPESVIASGVITPICHDSFRQFFKNMDEGIPSGNTNFQTIHPDGSLHWYYADYTLIFEKDNNNKTSIVSFYDNTEMREKEIAYELRRKELIELAENSAYYAEANLMTGEIEQFRNNVDSDEVFYKDQINLYTLVDWDAKNNIFIDDSESYREFFDKNRLISLHAYGINTDTIEFRSSISGRLNWYRITIQLVKYPHSDDIRIYVIFKNVNNEHLEKETLLAKSSIDSLTGLLNREETMRKIEDTILEGKQNTIHALFMIDIDNFKDVNDNLGHQSGDEALSSLATSIRKCFSEDDIVGRIGGDEFFVFMKNLDKAENVRVKANSLIKELQYVCAVRGQQLNLSASVGITIFHSDAKPPKTLNQLYSEADAALYKAKSLGKNCYAFADDLEIVSSEPLAIASQGILALNLQALLNNLGNGIEIYHGSKDGKLIPLFCNQSFLNLLGGMTTEEFFEVYGKDAFSGIYPDDLEEFITIYKEAYNNRSSFKHTYRIRGKNKKYYWVTVFSNFVWYDDQSFDLYSIYSDAESFVRIRDIQEERYRAFRDYKKYDNDKTLATFILNLTKDECISGITKFSILKSALKYKSATEVFNDIYSSISSPNVKEQCMKMFNCEALNTSFNKAESTKELEILFNIETENKKWLKMTSIVAINPDTSEIEAMIKLIDINQEVELQYILKQILNLDYEFLGLIDVQNAKITEYGSDYNGNAIQAKGSKPVDYARSLPIALQTIVRASYYDEACNALKIEKIISELRRKPSYVCTFPTKQVLNDKQGFKRWRCSYIDDEQRYIMVTRVDVTDLLSNERDPLTGLYNQYGFYNKVKEVLNRNPNINYRICRFDFDGFKLLNDTLGFTEGDRVLRDFGQVLRRRAELLKDRVIFARLDADHFVSFRPNDSAQVQELMDELMHWAEKYPINYRLAFHMGVYHVENRNMPVSAMCDRALLALKSIKSDFTKRVAIYNETMRDQLVDEQELTHDMEIALDNEQFEVYLQPQINYDDNSLIGAEALVRWRHPTKGLVPPNNFIPIFERNGFITKLDEYIWEKSCQCIRKWLDNPKKYLPVSLSVNISRVDIYNPKLVETLINITSKYNVPKEMLKLEITESAYMENPDQLINVVAELQKQGFTIEMDDFGSGYSSLNTLKNVPVNILKLDLKFLVKTESDERGGNILSSIIRMAHWLKMPIIAEGVETKSQADYLKSLGCYYMQGYYFARPMPVADFEQKFASLTISKTNRYDNVDLKGVAAFWDASAQTALLFNSLVGGAAILEYNGKERVEILRANDKFYEQLGTTRDEYLVKQLDTLKRFNDENRKMFVEMLQEAIETKNEAECTIKSLPLKEGENHFWTHSRVRMLAQNGDNYLFYLAVDNVTERKDLEEELRMRSEALQLSVNKMKRTICTYDIANRTLYLPEEYAKKHGTPTIIHNDQHLNLGYKVLPDDQKKYIEFYKKIKNGVQNASVLVRIIDFSGSGMYSWEKYDSVTIFDDDGRAMRAIITIEDQTAQMNQEVENVRTNVILEHTGISLLDYDVFTDTMHFMSNSHDKGHKVMYNYFSEFLDSGESRVHKDDIQKQHDVFADIINSEAKFGSYEIRSNNWGTGYIWTTVNYVSLADENGKIYRVVGQITNNQKEKDDEVIISMLTNKLNVGGEKYKFNPLFVERVFTTIYGSNDLEETIHKVLTLIGEYYDFSRVYVLKASDNYKSLSTVFKWCNESISSELERDDDNFNGKDINLEKYQKLFDEDGILYCNDITKLPNYLHDLLSSYDIKSVLQCAVIDNGIVKGYIGFDECKKDRIWDNEQIGTLLLVSRIIGSFLIKHYQQENSYFSDDFMKALDNNASYIYIVDPTTYEIVYNNKTIRDYTNESYEGKTCYKEFINRDKPCENCPLNSITDNGSSKNVEILRADGMLVLSQATPLYWKGNDLMMITSVDVTERLKLRNELSHRAKLLQSLYDTMPCAILQYTIKNNERLDLIFNDAAVSMLGYTDKEEFKEAVIEFKDTKYVHPDDYDFVYHEITKVLNDGGSSSYKHRFLYEDNTISWVKVQIQRFTKKDGSYTLQVLLYKISENE